jgi:hypothetical protein
MGCVHLARQTPFDRIVAVQRVRPDRLCDAAVHALLAEARLWSALDHPNIVPVHLLGRSGSGEPVLVMKRSRAAPGATCCSPPRAEGSDRGEGAGWREISTSVVVNPCDSAAKDAQPPRSGERLGFPDPSQTMDVRLPGRH